MWAFGTLSPSAGDFASNYVCGVADSVFNGPEFIDIPRFI